MMAASSRMMRVGFAAAATMLAMSTAQSISATNASQSSADIGMTVWMGDDKIPMAPILPLTMAASTELPPPGLSGPVLLVNQTNTIVIGPQSSNYIVVMSCDASAYPGFTTAMSVFNAAQQANVTAVLWYSQESDWCDLHGYNGGYPWVYSMSDVNDTTTMLDNINTFMEGDTHGVYDEQVYISIGATTAENQVTNGTSPNGSGSGHQQNQGNHLPGPSPSTAVAMIILYSITGIITGLFLVIIVTGAVRAHRHPERYGPSAITGGPRQSRARGLARAMLEALPIVKVGERPDAKPTDIELAEGGNGRNIPIETIADGNDASEAITPSHATRTTSTVHTDDAERRQSTSAEGGIAPASSDAVGAMAPPQKEDDNNHQGCSICTEDFEMGQDQRVLPCDHRFHPACIDPWLLNVSGTCPLCRIDLRGAQTSSDEVDSNGNPVTRDGEEMAPPLDGDTRRISVRRSLMLALMGPGRPDRLTREERVQMLRQYQAQQAGRRQQEAERQVGETAPASPAAATATAEEEERGLRTRLRNAFRVRTRRTGSGDEGDSPRS